MGDLRRLLDINQTADFFGWKAQTVRNKLHKGEMPVKPVKLPNSRRLRWDGLALERYVDSLSQNPEGQQ